MPIFRAENKMGITSDAEFGESGTAIQTDYTQVAQAIKAHNSTYARNGLDYKGTVLDAQGGAGPGRQHGQGLGLLACSATTRGSSPRAASAVDGQYVWLNFLPFEDKGSNATLDGFLKYDKTPDGFGAQAFIAGMIFAQAVNDTMKAHDERPERDHPGQPARPRSATCTTSTPAAWSRRSTSVARSAARAWSACRCRTASSCASTRSSRERSTATTTSRAQAGMTITIDPAKEYHG